MLTNTDITEFLNKYDYDIRKTGNARWIDQKCTPDVITIISDCIYNFHLNNSEKFFTSSDIRFSDYARSNVVEIFKKPEVDSDKAEHEYDKFFQQPMELLAASHVLTKYKVKNRNVYEISDIEILDYLALREKNSLYFLKEYITKTLKDSGIYPLFETFFNNQTPENYSKMKSGFSSFTIKNTPINKELECNRIFIKVLNPLAYFKNSLGTVKGRLSKDKITYDMLMYNRNNFRDINAEKPKNVTRKEYMQSHKIVFNKAYYRYQSQKAKRVLHDFNTRYRRDKSEYDDEYANAPATEIRHIFPESKYPEISYYLENLIALTPTQHLNCAHPNHKTGEISKSYQHKLLLAKVERIKENLNSGNAEKKYSFSNLLKVLAVAFEDDGILNIDNNYFDAIVDVINSHYLSEQ